MLLDDGEVGNCTPEIDNCQREASLINWGGPYLQGSAVLLKSQRCVRTVRNLEGRRQATEVLKSTVKVGTDTGRSG